MDALTAIKNALSVANLLTGSSVPSGLIDRVFAALEAAADEGLDLLENEFAYLKMHLRRAAARGDNPTEFLERWLKNYAV